MQEFLEFVAGILNVDVSSISLDTEDQALPQWDSIMQLRLVMEIEERYGIEFPFDAISNLHKLGDLYQYVQAD